MLRIEKLLGKTSTVLKLSGRIQEEHLSEHLLQSLKTSTNFDAAEHLVGQSTIF
jgi:hypothetical protein